MKRFLSLLLFLPILGLLSCNSPQARQEFIILQINDVYELGPLEAGKSGGLERVATVLKELKAENPNTIFVLSGDFLNPSLIGSLKDKEGNRIKGAQMVDVLNEMGLDYATFGNHELDLKEEELQARINESEFKWISANVRQESESGPVRFRKYANNEIETIPDYSIKSFKYSDGSSLRVGLTGVTLEFNEKPYVFYRDIYESAEEIQKSMASKADVTLALTHLSLDQDRELAKKAQGFPLLMGGHEHDHKEDTVGNVRIYKADANAKSVYIHRISYDPGTKKVEIFSELKQINDQIPSDPEIKLVVDKWKSFADSSLMSRGFDPYNVVGTFEQKLDGRESVIRNEPSELCALFARAYAWSWPKADAAVFNSGSVRVDDILQGTIMESDILRSLPFGGKIALVKMKGSELVQMLETGSTTNKGSGGFLQFSGISIQEGTFFINEKEIEPAGTYAIALPQFMAEGREKNLDFLKDLPSDSPETLKDTVPNDARQIVIAYLESGGN